MQKNHLHEIRFSGDRDGAKALAENSEIAEILQSCADGKHALGSARRDLLANAVRVDRHILPDLDQVVSDLKTRAGSSDLGDAYGLGLTPCATRLPA